MKSQRSTRNLQLDVLRGAAILLVIGRHLEFPRPDGPVGWFADVWFRVGWLGVDLFFVLSGFLIGGLLVTEIHKHGRIDIPHFLIRRGLKIYPPYFVFIAYLIWVPVAKTLAQGGDAWNSAQSQWSMYWPNLLFVQNYVGTNPAGHTWSLAVEEHFYLLLPLALAALLAVRRISILVPLCLLMIPLLLLGVRTLSVALNDSYAVTMSATHLRLDALLFGVGIRGVAQYYPALFQALRSRRIVLAVAGGLLWSVNLFVEPQSPLIRTIGLNATYWGGGAFLLAVLHTHAADFGVTRPLVDAAARLLAWVGVSSYAIYLWHVTALGILGREIGERLLAWNGGGNSQSIWILTTLTATAGAIAAGMIATKVVEWPVLRFRDRFFPSRSASLPSDPVSAAPGSGAAAGTEGMVSQ